MPLPSLYYPDVAHLTNENNKKLHTLKYILWKELFFSVLTNQDLKIRSYQVKLQTNSNNDHNIPCINAKYSQSILSEHTM
jgi:hypothetical protein